MPQLIHPQPFIHPQFQAKTDFRQDQKVYSNNSPNACPFANQANHGNVWNGLRSGAGRQNSPIGYSKTCCSRMIPDPNFTKTAVTGKENNRRISNHSNQTGTGNHFAIFQTSPVDECVFQHLNLQSQRNISQKVVDHTYRLYGSSLLYAKDVPTFQVNNSLCLRKLDTKPEKWLRFEVEYAQESDEKTDQIEGKQQQNETGSAGCLNLSLYDQADPVNLYLATINHQKFEKLMSKQNLVIEQFSQLAGHIQLLLDSCITNLPNELTHTLDCENRAQCCDRKFICAINPYVKHRKCTVTEQQGVNVNIYQGNEFRNLLHLSIFFRKASDAEARPWLAKKHMISWGIINELALQIENLDIEVSTEQQSFAELKKTLQFEQQHHKKQVEKLTAEFTEQITISETSHTNQKEQIEDLHEQQVQQMKSDHQNQIQDLTSQLEDKKQRLEESIVDCINTKSQLELSKQKCLDLAQQIDRLTHDLLDRTQKLEQITMDFNSKDKEALQIVLEKSELEKSDLSRKTDNEQMNVQLKDLTQVKINQELDIQRLEAKVALLQSEKQHLEISIKEQEKSLKDKKDKKEKLKSDKKQLKHKIKEFENIIKQRESEIDSLRKRNEDTLEIVKEEKQIIVEQSNQIASLKDKLREAMETLQKNSETIEALNKSLMEAQKFSFRALLSNKQTNAQITTAAHTNYHQVGQKNTIFSNRNLEDMNLSRSRSRSPLDLGAQTTSPLKIIDRQRYNGGLMLNSSSFSNLKQKMGQNTPVHNYTPTIRESQAAGTANHQIDYSQPCDCKDYQANLKVTNKYAERFGLNDKAPQTAYVPINHKNQASFGKLIEPYTGKMNSQEPTQKKDEKASHNKFANTSQRTLHDEQMNSKDYGVRSSHRYSEHNDD